MGRGRGKGRKLTTVTSNEDTGSGDEELLPAYKRRGRPQKHLKDEIDEVDAEKTEEEEEKEKEKDLKLNTPSKEVKGSTLVYGVKRKKHSKTKENSDIVKVESYAGSESKEQSTSSNGFRHNGSRRKGKPRRAAQAGVECK